MTKIVGLTGGIGSGKTTIAKEFGKLGVPVYIADEQAKYLTELPSTLSKIREEFGDKIFTEGKLDRAELGKIVFSNKEKLQKLNKIIHPIVAKHFENWVKEHQNNTFVIKESALLFETENDKKCDYIISVIAPLELRVQRIMDRDNMSLEEIKQRIDNQVSDEIRIQKSDFIIENINLNDAVIKVLEINELLK